MSALNPDAMGCHILNEQHSVEFVESLALLHLEKQYSDVYFICKDNHYFPANKAVLASVSDFLSTLLNTDIPGEHYINLPDVSIGTMELLTTFLYFGKVGVSPEQMEKIRDVVNLLGVRFFNVEMEPIDSTTLNISGAENSNITNIGDDRNGNAGLSFTTSTDNSDSKNHIAIQGHLPEFSQSSNGAIVKAENYASNNFNIGNFHTSEILQVTNNNNNENILQGSSVKSENILTELEAASTAFTACQKDGDISVEATVETMLGLPEPSNSDTPPVLDNSGDNSSLVPVTVTVLRQEDGCEQGIILLEAEGASVLQSFQNDTIDDDEEDDDIIEIKDITPSNAPLISNISSRKRKNIAAPLPPEIRDVLMKEFEVTPYLTREKCLTLADGLGLDSKKIMRFFSRQSVATRRAVQVSTNFSGWEIRYLLSIN